MPGTLEGKTAIVTGGGWNIGRAIALRFAREGARVAVGGRREDLLRETEQMIRGQGGEALGMSVDVTSWPEVETFVARTLERFGGVDVLAAIAGGGVYDVPIDEIDPGLWANVIRANVIGTFHAVRAALPAMRKKKAGSILTCTGGGAFYPLLGVHHTAYATAKAGLCRFTDQLAAELFSAGIRVNCLEPGMTWSENDLRRIEEEERRTGTPHPQRAQNHSPEDAAELAAWLASDASVPLTGRTVSVDDDWWRDPEKVRAVCASLHAYTLRRAEGP
jgi:NAD(P)-dependent dehydrogenase (short-subunit alcohol dehydrogenase family)